jgi:hypothetical protein
MQKGEKTDSILQFMEFLHLSISVSLPSRLQIMIKIWSIQKYFCVFLLPIEYSITLQR